VLSPRDLGAARFLSPTYPHLCLTRALDPEGKDVLCVQVLVESRYPAAVGAAPAAPAHPPTPDTAATDAAPPAPARVHWRVMRRCRNYAVRAGDVVKVQAFELEVVRVDVEKEEAPKAPEVEEAALPPRPHISGRVPLDELAARLMPAFVGAATGRSMSDSAALGCKGRPDLALLVASGGGRDGIMMDESR
jgi:hypothetical protein